MSPISQLSVLAFASAVLASPYAGHGHHYAHRHLHSDSGASKSYSAANSTSFYSPTGTGKLPSYGSPSIPVYANQNGGSTLTSTVFQTVYATLHSSAATSDAQVGAAGESSQCTSDVTVTNTAKVYVTVTAGEAPSSSAAAVVSYGSSSSSASPVESSSSVASAPAYSAPVYSAPSSSSSKAEPVSTSSASAPAYSAPAYSAPSSSEAEPVSSSSTSMPAYSAPAYTSSSESSPAATHETTSSTVAPVSSAPAYTPTTESSSSSSAAAILPSAYSVPDKGSETSATASAPASYSSTASSSSGKRGLAYNDASLTDCFSGSDMVSWAYNWVSSSAGLTGFNYIPTLHSDISDFTSSWSSDAQKAINSGSTTLFSFNEPDIASQSNLGVADAVLAHTKYMGPFQGKAKICAPSVSNSGSSNEGLDYLKQFLAQCTGSDCPVDCLNVHWYSPCDSDGFISYMKGAVDMLTGDQTLYVSEFGTTTGSDSDIASFLEDVMAYMDGEPKIAGYAYFMVSDGKLVTGNEPSTYGSTYKTYTS